MQVCYSIKDVSYGFIFILLLIGTIIFIFYHSVLKRVLFKVLFTMLIIISLVVVYFIKSNVIQAMINNWLNVSLSEMNNSIYESLPTYFYQYKPILVIAIPLLIIIFITLAIKTWGNSIIFFNLGMMINFWYTGYSETIKLYLFKCLFLTVITYYCNANINNKRLLNKRGIKVPDENVANTLYVFAIAFCMSLIITIMPQEAKGKFDSNIFTKWTNAYSENKKIKDLPGIGLKYDISLSGYDNGDSKLGGPISIDYTLVLKVKSDKPYYLKGAVKDIYDGYSWTRSNTFHMKNKSTVEPVFNDKFSMPYFQGNNSIIVYPEGIKTSTFFTPKNTYAVDAGNLSVFYDDIPTFLSNDFVTKSYTVNFYNDKSDINVIFKDDYLKSIGTENELIPQFYSQNKNKYLQIPLNLNPNIYPLAYLITKDCKTDFERVEKIKEYLSKNYKYSLKVSEVPKNQEFLDYFLNVEKQGYCTYFATAATIFCRIVGIQARYVEGYNMTDKKDDKGLFMVTNENAHAWTEVLLLSSKDKGIWYTLDCVPNAADEIERVKKAEQAAITGETDVPSSVNLKKKPNTKNNLLDTDLSITNKKKLSKGYIASIIAFSIIVLLIIIRHIMFEIKKIKIIRSKSIIPLYNYSLKRLEKVRIKKSDTETDKEFVHKINDNNLKNNMNNMVVLCYAEFYGNKEIEGFDKVKYYEFIEKFIKSKQNIIKYYFIKYIF
jgi:transglutaminase-like putative cysteine protease